MCISLHSEITLFTNVYYFPTLYNNLVTWHQYLLAVRGLCILKDGGALLGSARVGHGDGLKSLEAFRSRSCQLDRAIRGYGN